MLGVRDTAWCQRRKDFGATYVIFTLKVFISDTFSWLKKPNPACGVRDEKILE